MTKREFILIPGNKSFFGERIVGEQNSKHRIFHPKNSKFAEMLVDYQLEIEGKSLLYLGAAHGYTASFLAPVANKIFCVEFAPVPFKKLLALSKEFDNIYPIFADAREPKNYSFLLPEIDILCQDISQRDQSGIFIRNMKLVKDKGYGILMLKIECLGSQLNLDEKIKNNFSILYRKELRYKRDHIGLEHERVQMPEMR